MQIRTISITVFLLSLCQMPIPAMANSMAASAGGLVVDSDTDFFLSTAATGDLCVHTEVLGMPGTFTGNAGVATGCSLEFDEPFEGTFNGEGYLGVVKFPSPVARQGTRNITKLGTTATAISAWESKGTNFLTRRADHTTSAFVTRTNQNAPAGLALANSNDPWIFTPDQNITLNLTVELINIALTTSTDSGEDAVAAIFASAAFGLGPQPGVNVLVAGTDFAREISGNDSLTLPSVLILSLVDVQLMNGQTYWLTADIMLGAQAVPVPEPATAFLVAVGLAALAVVSRHRAPSGRGVRPPPSRSRAVSGTPPSP